MAEDDLPRLLITRMTHVTVTLPDGFRRDVPVGTTVRALMADLPPRLAKSALAAAVNGQVVDLSFALGTLTRRCGSSCRTTPGRSNSTATAPRT